MSYKRLGDFGLGFLSGMFLFFALSEALFILPAMKRSEREVAVWKEIAEAYACQVDGRCSGQHGNGGNK